MIKMSLIVPFYNVEQYFAQCLDSLVSQTMAEMEIILVDDCSPDGSLAIAKRYAEQDSRIKIISHAQNLRQGGARNTGLKAATGDYIWFIDSDDWISPYDSANHLYRLASSHQVDFINFNHVKKFEDGRAQELVSFIDKAGVVKGNKIVPLVINKWHDDSPYSKLFKRTWLLEHECFFKEHIIFEDNITPFWLLTAKKALLLDETLYFYRIRPNSTLTSIAKIRDLASSITVVNQSFAFLQNNHLLAQPAIATFYTQRALYRLFNAVRMHDVWHIATKNEKQTIATLLYKELTSLLALNVTPFKPFNPPYAAPHGLKNFNRMMHHYVPNATPKQQYSIIAINFKKRPFALRWLKKAVKFIMPYGLIRLYINKKYPESTLP